ncbi:DNA-binding transcriptional regulator, AcrR family [Allopseudospirillum japonicum]|uniref:DNA-binding transcriptional regulator, AcrR family n=1 Tax=Allopseudospirillum japonicum TaxID=64971 RepID=A0A1H6S0G3_9GAMM|nr:TetR/AcrR family transcriptional regulator [Allopseudospirillum japonicum]SEI61513.1 DNA-binding transcriptional regulator, AcrR family [Allopseudospirillum japonicum]
MSASTVEKQARKVQEFRLRETRILESALELFLQYGEDRVTVEMIADHVGIGKGTIYKHFRTKAEIYVRLMLDYEREMAALFQSPKIAEDKEALSRAYFEFRMQNPEKYLLFNRLEEKLVKSNSIPELIEEVHKFRARNLESLSDLINARVSEGHLEDVPPYFHYCASWALVHGAAVLNQSQFFQEVIQDKEEFFRFLMDIGVRMGNRGQRGRRLRDAELGTNG